MVFKEYSSSWKLSSSYKIISDSQKNILLKFTIFRPLVAQLQKQTQFSSLYYNSKWLRKKSPIVFQIGFF